ncbi:unnamed protein product [Brassicogethes aeneus]|uniref:Poly [ADP-ribose] polymerase n=1 Tax=Brassicogethes aeneus TaxID=1431903 RepID=A0A9P0AV13_BRAAE|nr:unnamed protein product [Brassicogethes aeneus]
MIDILLSIIIVIIAAIIYYFNIPGDQPAKLTGGGPVFPTYRSDPKYQSNTCNVRPILQGLKKSGAPRFDLRNCVQECGIQKRYVNPDYIVKPNSLITELFSKTTERPVWSQEENLFTNRHVHEFTDLEESSKEFERIEELLNKSNRNCFEVTRIRRVLNKYLLLQYELKKRSLTNPMEKLLFHGTKQENIDVICANNFNWRLCGTSRGHIFGQGVSFAKHCTYASHYSDKTYSKVVILSKVLVSKSCVGEKNTVVPKEPCDTTTKSNGDVFVKYDDFTFYPKYVVYYEGEVERNYTKPSIY